MSEGRQGAGPPKRGKFAFVARLLRIKPLYGVDVPAEVSEAIGVRGVVPVEVRVSRGAPFRASLLPRGGGRHRIFLNGEVRKAAGAEVGDRLALEVRVDARPREVAIPEDLADALREEGVREDWESLPSGKREHILRWIEQAVHEDTRAKRVVRAVEEALARHEKRIDRGMC